MKDLREIARELACLEEDVRRLGTRLGRLGMELDHLREAEAGGPIDFEAVRVYAECFPYRLHPLMRVEMKDLWRYPAALLSLARWNGTDMNLLVFCQWILDKTRSRKSLEDCLTASYRTDVKQYQWLRQNLDGDMKQIFLLDLMIAASLSGPPCKEALEYVSEMAALLNCGEWELYVLTLEAGAVLRQSLDWMEREDVIRLLQLPGQYRLYLPEQMFEQTREKLRQIVLRDTGDTSRISWKKNQGEQVRKGDVLAKIKTYTLWSHSSEEVESPASGWFYHFSLNKVSYGVLSGPGDSKDRLKSWVAAMEEPSKGGKKKK